MVNFSKILVLLLLQVFTVSVCQAGFISTSDEDVSVYATAEQMKNEAIKVKPVLWKLPLGQRIIEQMTVLDNNLALLELKNYNDDLRKDQIQVVNLTTGKQLWSYITMDDIVTTNIVAVTSSLVIVESVYQTYTKLLAFKLISGIKSWEKKLPKVGLFQIKKINNSNFIIANIKNNKITYNLYDYKLANKKWTYSIPYPINTIPKIHINENKLFIFGKHISVINAKSGKLIWKNSSLSVDASNVNFNIENNNLFITSKDNIFYRLNSNKGTVIWKKKISELYNIYALSPKGSNVYLRGAIKSSNNILQFIIAIDKNNGKKMWQMKLNGSLPIVSNIIEYNDKLFVASPTSLYFLNKNSGKGYSIIASKTQLSIYPVILRLIGDKIIFIGEMNVAAYNANTGILIYRKSITPISQEADLSAMESSIKRLSKVKDMEYQISWGFTEYARNNAVKFRAYENKVERGEWTAGIEGSDKRWQRFDDIMARLELIRNVTLLLYHQADKSFDEETLARHKLIRNSIHSAYPEMMTQNYVFRPTRNLSLMDDAPEFLQITAINLKNGKKKRTTMSVPFKDYGLWVHVDEKNKIAYQQSIGLNYKGEKPPISYLIAKPINLPK